MHCGLTGRLALLARVDRPQGPGLMGRLLLTPIVRLEAACRVAAKGEAAGEPPGASGVNAADDAAAAAPTTRTGGGPPGCCCCGGDCWRAECRLGAALLAPSLLPAVNSGLECTLVVVAAAGAAPAAVPAALVVHWLLLVCEVLLPCPASEGGTAKVVL
jgi:hypothetical protein